MAANGTGSLVFIAYVTADRGSEMNSEGYKAILLDHIQPKATKLTGQQTFQRNNDHKHTAKTTHYFLEADRWDMLQRPSQSADFNSIGQLFN